MRIEPEARSVRAIQAVEDLPQRCQHRHLTGFIVFHITDVNHDQVAIRVKQQSLTGPAAFVDIVVFVYLIPLIDVVFD